MSNPLRCKSFSISENILCTAIIFNFNFNCYLNYVFNFILVLFLKPNTLPYNNLQFSHNLTIHLVIIKN